MAGGGVVGLPKADRQLFLKPCLEYHGGQAIARIGSTSDVAVLLFSRRVATNSVHFLNRRSFE